MYMYDPPTKGIFNSVEGITKVHKSQHCVCVYVVMKKTENMKKKNNKF